MPMQFVIDIHHYLNEYGEFPDGLPKQALKMASYFAMLIEAATKHKVGMQIKTGFPCRKKKCRGKVATIILDLNSDIYWVCSDCMDQGTISNWQDTKWNEMQIPEFKL